ncbi:MAG: response regulator, partial [Gammaproteobacteria bacterium]|nr:response regulator [Gammaproteobacteria bacterium]
MTPRVRVLVVDDSLFFQRRITDILQREPAIEVIGHATDGLQAVAAARKLKPDVITMDVEMPV